MTARARGWAIAALIGVAAGTSACPLPPPPWAFHRHDHVEHRDRWERDHVHRDRWERGDDRRERYERSRWRTR